MNNSLFKKLNQIKKSLKDLNVIELENKTQKNRDTVYKSNVQHLTNQYREMAEFLANLVIKQELPDEDHFVLLDPKNNFIKYELLEFFVNETTK